MLKNRKKVFPKKYLLQSLLLAILSSSFSIVSAQTHSPQQKVPAKNVQIFNGSTIDKIKSTRSITVGFNPSSAPISYKINNTPVGYGIDVCLLIIQNLKKTYGIEDLAVKYKEVDNSNKIQEILSGGIDVECGSTSNTETRRKNVDFAIPYYVSSVRMLINKNSGIQNFSDIQGKSVSLVNGTTSLELMDKLNKERRLNIQPVIVSNFTDGIMSVSDNKAQVFVLDDLLLYNELSKLPNPDNFIVLDEQLSVEPLAIMLRKDDLEFKRFVNSQLSYFMNTGLMDNLYNKWFKSPIPPNNKSLNIPQSYLLKDVFRMPTDIVGN